MRPLLRAYSIASANWEEQLEFFSIKVPNGPLTSRLRDIQPGDSVLIGRKPTGTLLIHDLHPGRNLYLFGTGTGLAPWLAIVKDPDTYERFERVVLCHGVRSAGDLAYRDYIVNELPRHEFLGEQIAEKLLYYPAVTREDFAFDGRDQRGRLTELLDSGRMTADLGLAAARRRTRSRDDLRQPAGAGRFPRPARCPRLQRRAAHRRAGPVRVRARIRREVAAAPVLHPHAAHIAGAAAIACSDQGPRVPLWRRSP